MTKSFQTIELEHLFEKVKTKYQVDLSNYAQASLERRIERFLTLHYFHSIKELADKICSETSFFDIFIKEITVNTTEMFRDPDCWRTIREKVLPCLRDLPTIRIWHAGCSSGEEIYSMAILLKEEGLLEKASLVASDLNKEVIETAKKGKYPKKNIEINAENYYNSGGTARFSDYYDEADKDYVMHAGLLSKVRFIKHDLSSGNPFSKFDIIICRNVLIYFNKSLQEKVFELFNASLFKKGFLLIGKKESMSYYSHFGDFVEFDAPEKIYRLR